MSNDRVVVGINVGTTKVCALIAEVSEDDHLEVIGTGIGCDRRGTFWLVGAVMLERPQLSSTC